MTVVGRAMVTVATRPVDTNIEERDDPRVLWPMIVLFWIVNVAMTTAQVYVNARSSGNYPALLGVLGFMLKGFAVWLLSVPVIVLVLTRRFRFEGGRWRVSIPVHLAVSLLIATAIQLWDALIFVTGNPTRQLLPTFVMMARTWMLWAVFTYWFFVVYILAVRHYTTSAARKLRATQLTAAVANAQLELLRTRLHPHFLFNALNSISSLIFDEPREAQRMLARLGELLRATLAEDGQRSWALRRELELLERYTAIEQVRFGERLVIELACEPAALDADVPTLLLQPLVENAILHGIQPSMRGGTVRIAARREGGGRWLALEVDDDGIGMPAGNGNGLGERVGLSSTRERLEKHYGDEQSFRIVRREPSGTRVSIRIPWAAWNAGDAESR
ncbi:MAG: histidine kinase [Gemmatimonadaceae bacterium]